MSKNHFFITISYENYRAEWEKWFQLMAKNEDDILLDSDTKDHFWDQEE